MRSATISPAPPEAAAEAVETAAALCAALDRIAPDGALGVAVSGGGDSVALLAIAADWARAGGRRIEAATVDHRLRAESAAEAAAVAALAARLGLAHAVLPWAEAPGAGNLLAAARAARHRLLGGWARERGLAGVLLGHTLDDQAETVLIRLARGAAADGLSGMAESVGIGGTLWLRPMLGIRRAALRRWLAAAGLGWAEDPTNADARHDRVRARTALATLAAVGITAEGLARTAGRLRSQRRALEAAATGLGRVARSWGALGEAEVALGPLRGAAEDTVLRLLADTLRRVGGAIDRPRQDGLARLGAALAADRAAGTLVGCRWRIGAGRLTVWREAARQPPPAAAAEGAACDRRGRVAGAPAGATVGALGAAGLAALRESGAVPPPAWAAAPAVLRATVPAIRVEGRLVAVPQAGFAVPGAGTVRLSDLARPPGEPDAPLRRKDRA